MFIGLLSFSISLACDQTKGLFLYDEPCMVRPTIIDMNPVELKYYPSGFDNYHEIAVRDHICYVCQKFGVLDLHGQIPKSQVSYLLPSDFPNNFS